MSCGIGLVTTLRDAGDTIGSFIAWHRALGFDRLFLFFDDPHDPDLPRVAALPGITAIPHDAMLTRAWKRLPEYTALAPFTAREVMARQVLNVGVAMELAQQHDLTWLLHIDTDELFFSPNQPLDALFATRAETLHFPNFEAVPESAAITDAFRAVDLFKPPPGFNAGLASAQGQALLAATPQLPPPFGFHFYTNGKSAVRLDAPGLRPTGVHTFARLDGPTRQESAAAYVLHYACCGFEAFWRKYRTLGHFNDRWFGQTDIRTEIGTLHLEARDVVMNGDRQAALDFYRQRIAIEDLARVAALIDAGLLLRIPEPGQCLNRRT